MGAKSASVAALTLTLIVTSCDTSRRGSAASDTTPHGGKVTITLEQARLAAATFLQLLKPGRGITAAQVATLFPRVMEDVHPRVGRVWEMSGAGGMVAVDASSGAIVSYSNGDDVEEAEGRITLADAETAMRTFLRVAYPQFDEKRFKLEERAESDGRFDFTFEQIRLPGEVSIYTNSVAVSVRADKPLVTSFDRSALNFIRRTPTRLNAEDARRIVQGIVGPRARITAIDLFEHPAADLSRAVTVWAASVEKNVAGFDDLEMILLNADTGERVPLQP
jgi:hypothetical protein